MIYKKKEAQAFTIPGGSSGLIYPQMPNNDHSVAYVETDGKYPESGYSLNDFCTETFFIVDGAFKLEIDGIESEIEKGDLAVILPGKKYRLEGKGKVIDMITPAWDSKQNHIVE